MTDYPLSVQTHTDGDFHHGWTQNSEDAPKIPWVKLTDEAHKEKCWFLYPPQEIFDRWGWEHLDRMRYEELQNFLEPIWVDGVKYIFYATGNNPDSFKTIINWLLGPIAEVLNEWDMDSSCLWETLHPVTLRDFYNLTLDEGFIKSKSKDAVRDLMQSYSIEHIIANESYWAGDTGELDAMIETVFERENEKIMEGNPDKIGNWIVGQVMKETKGQADPAMVRTKVFEKVAEVFQ